MYYIHKQHRSSVVQTDGYVDPNEFYAVPAALQGKLSALLPFFTLVIEDGEIVDITDDAEARAAYIPPVPPPSETDELRAELLETQLALCEMFELVLSLTGGDA